MPLRAGGTARWGLRRCGLGRNMQNLNMFVFCRVLNIILVLRMLIILSNIIFYIILYYPILSHICSGSCGSGSGRLYQTVRFVRFGSPAVRFAQNGSVRKLHEKYWIIYDNIGYIR